MKTALPKKMVIEMLNEDLRAEPWFEEGMEVTDASMVSTRLVMEIKGVGMTMKEIQGREAFSQQSQSRYVVRD